MRWDEYVPWIVSVELLPNTTAVALLQRSCLHSPEQQRLTSCLMLTPINRIQITASAYLHVHVPVHTRMDIH